VGLDVTDQLLIRFSAFVRYWRKNGSTMRQYISYDDEDEMSCGCSMNAGEEERL
jgi:hypothetical protein